MTELARLLRPCSRRPVLLWALCTLLLTLACVLAWDAYGRYHKVATGQQDLARLRSANHIPLPRKISREEQEKRKRWAALQAERDFRWYPVFRGLEGASAEAIELLEFAPDKVNRTFLLRGEARDVDGLIRYLEALTHQDGFHRVYLAHQKTLNRDGMSVVTFEIKGALLQP